MLDIKDNYLIKLDDKNLTNYCLYYHNLICNFYEKIKKNKNINITIFNYGLDTFHHIYNFILYYTKNIQLTMTYSNNALIYYIEFIQQIKDKNNLFLKLKKEDAVLFVYKKTIFKLNKSFLRKENNNKELIYIYKLTNYCNYLIKDMIKNFDINYEVNDFDVIKKKMSTLYDKNMSLDLNILKINEIKNNLN